MYPLYTGTDKCKLANTVCDCGQQKFERFECDVYCNK